MNRNVDLCSISLHDSSHIFFQRLALNSLTNGAGVYPEFLGWIPAQRLVFAFPTFFRGFIILREFSLLRKLKRLNMRSIHHVTGRVPEEAISCYNNQGCRTSNFRLSWQSHRGSRRVHPQGDVPCYDTFWGLYRYSRGS